MKKVIAIILMLLMVLSVMAGCGQQTPATSPDASQPAQSTPSAQPASQEPDQPSPSVMQTYDVKMSIQYAPQQCVPYWHAKENGIFDKYGIGH
jgi:predicted small lipoprotein YifL